MDDIGTILEPSDYHHNAGSFYLREGHGMRYYFDLRDGDEIVPDEEGIELSTIEKVQEEAARSLADLARDAVRKQANGESVPRQHS